MKDDDDTADVDDDNFCWGVVGVGIAAAVSAVGAAIINLSPPTTNVKHNFSGRGDGVRHVGSMPCLLKACLDEDAGAVVVELVGLLHKTPPVDVADNRVAGVCPATDPHEWQRG